MSSFKQPSSITSHYFIITNRVIIVVRCFVLFADKGHGVLINFIARTFKRKTGTILSDFVLGKPSY